MSVARRQSIGGAPKARRNSIYARVRRMSQQMGITDKTESLTEYMLNDFRAFYNKQDGHFGVIDLKIGMWTLAANGTMKSGMFAEPPKREKGMVKESRVEKMLNKIRINPSGRRNFADFVRVLCKQLQLVIPDDLPLVELNQEDCCALETLKLMYDNLQALGLGTHDTVTFSLTHFYTYNIQHLTKHTRQHTNNTHHSTGLRWQGS